VFFEPAVDIVSPGHSSEFSHVDSVRFVAQVADLEDRATALRLVWRSDIDGVLSTQPALANGVAAFATDALSLGAHTIALRVEDSDGRVGADSIRVTIRSFAPVADIVAPSGAARFTPGEPITMSAHVFDRETRPESLAVVWSSDLDGVLETGRPDATGQTSITRSTLSAGVHSIRIAVTDKDGNSARDSVRVQNVLPGPISLAQPTVASSRVSLTWTSSTPAGFDRYEVYRATSPGLTRTGSPLRTFRSVTDTAWVDSLPPFATQVYYRVFVVNSFGYDRGSEERAVPSPGGLILEDVAVDDAVLHPTQPWIYLNDRSAGKITVVDYRAMSVRRTVMLGSSNGFMDLVDNGSGLELYVPRSDGWVQVRDPNDLQLVTSINTGLANASVVGDGRGQIYVSMSPSPWWERPLRSYRRSDGSYIDGNGDFEYCRLRLLEGGQSIIEITMSVSPIDMDYYLIAPDGRFLRHVDDNQHGGTPLDPHRYRVSPAQRYLVTSSSGAVYRADSTMAYLGQLPRGSLSFGDFAFSPDGGRIYAGCNNERLVKIHTFPSLSETGYLQTRGYPEFLWRVGDELIALSRTTSDPYYYGPFDMGIEVLAIPSAVQGTYPLRDARRSPGPERGLPTARLRPADPGH
jgi:hypothetical protein